MAKEAHKPLLITTRGRAVIALCAALYLTLFKLWTLTISPSHTVTSWLFPYGSFFPDWAVSTWNVFLYGCFVSLLIIVCRRMSGTERSFFALWMAGILATPAVALLPRPGALALQWTLEARNIAMIVAAAWIYREIGRTGQPVPDSSNPA